MVVCTPNISVIPYTPDFVKGVSNICGDIIPILDLGLRFGIVSQRESDNNIGKYTLVVKNNSDINLGVIVKDAPLSFATIEDKIDQIPSITNGNGAFKGFFNLEGRIVKLIDCL